MKIIKVEPDLIEKTSDYASKLFIEYYIDLIGSKQAQYMASLFLSKEAITKLISNGAIFKLVVNNNTILGFTEYLLEDNRVFLSKLYVSKEYRNKGIGKLMLEDCIKYAKENNKDSIYLTVNKGNTNSIEIYKHIGFKIIDSVINDIGNNYYMDDYIMELSIK